RTTMLHSTPRRLAFLILVLGLASLYPMLQAPAQLARPIFPPRPIILPIRPPTVFPGGNNPNITIGGGQNQQGNQGNQGNNVGNFSGSSGSVGQSGNVGQIGNIGQAGQQGTTGAGGQQGFGGIQGGGFGFQPIVIPGSFGAGSSI